MNKVFIANPIYDVVFKYLMEDEQISRVLLSALLKKNIVDVKIRRHEYTNTRKNAISFFRIDFGATVKDEDGSEHLVLIELQKTWLATETLRFRQYLALHYSNQENMVYDKKSNRSYGLPTVAVYLLGHKVGDINEPVIYVNRSYLNSDGCVIPDSRPNAFIESLSHDSIIVQIPLLTGLKRHNKLESILRIFDQSQIGQTNQLLEIDMDSYSEDTDLSMIVNRLTRAAADPEMRQQMNVEEEFLSELESRDTEIMQKNEQISKQAEQLSQQSEQLSQQSEQLSQKDKQLSQKDEQISYQAEQLKNNEITLMNIARTLKAQGNSIESISNITGLSVQKLQEI